MWFNGNLQYKRQKRRPGDRTKGVGWDTAGRKDSRGTRNMPEWDTDGVSKWETRRLNDMLAEYDGVTGAVRDDYYWHHNTLHGLSTGGRNKEDEPEWDTGKTPEDLARNNKKHRKKRCKPKSTIIGAVDCSEPEVYRLSRKFSSGQRFISKHKAEVKKIAKENERLRRNLHRVKYRSKVSGKSGQTNKKLVKRLRFQKEKSRKALAQKNEKEMAKRESLSILNAMKYRSTCSRRNPKTDVFLKTLKTRKEKAEWERLQKSAAYIMMPNDDGALLRFLLKEVDEEKTTEVQIEEDSTNDETEEKCSHFPKEHKVAVDEEDEEDAERMDKFELRDLKREIGATMAEGNMYKIRDIRNFFHDIIQKYNDRPKIQKKQIQQLIHNICVELDIAAVGRLAERSPDALKVA